MSYINNTASSAANLTSGTLPDGRLSSNVPLKNTANVFASTVDATAFKVGGVSGASGSVVIPAVATLTIVGGVITSIV